jgi:hypothetical protein
MHNPSFPSLSIFEYLSYMRSDLAIRSTCPGCCNQLSLRVSLTYNSQDAATTGAAIGYYGWLFDHDVSYRPETNGDVHYRLFRAAAALRLQRRLYRHWSGDPHADRHSHTRLRGVPAAGGAPVTVEGRNPFM